MSLKNRIVSEVTNAGPINISRFMEHCLYDKEFGYYTTKLNTIGALGDFITSPEISQVFGELIGLWLAQTWIDRGKPPAFNLVELGPGNGTMMRDILLAVKKLPEFAEAASLILIETSPTLRKRQKTLLQNYHPVWYNTITEIPDKPLFLVANEFLDALPIRQFWKNNNLWYERFVDLNATGDLHFAYFPSNLIKELNVLYRDIPDNVVVEISDISKIIVADVSEKLLQNGGVSLFIDYGYFEGAGETLQAMHHHSYADPLTNMGENDLTTQVNFKSIYDLVKRKGLRISELKTQRDFLLGLGIKQRSKTLAENLSYGKKKLHFNAINRLINNDQMGSLFKVIGMTNKGSPALPILE